MSAGLIDAERAAIIAAYTSCLSPEDAAKADEILAPAAPEVRAETLARRAAALEMKLDPEAAKNRKESTKRAAQRVEVKLERSGTPPSQVASWTSPTHWPPRPTSTPSPCACAAPA